MDPGTTAKLSLGCAVWLAVLAVLFWQDVGIIETVRDWPQWTRAISDAVTDLGNGGWMAQVTITVAAVGAVLSRGAKKTAWRAHGRLMLRTAVVFFVLLLASGIAVQLIKHIVGRPRPSLLEEVGAFHLVPFQPGTFFNSFPSGHSSTMAALAVLLGWLIPRLWPIWVTAAVVIGLSRVVSVQHYASDVIAGWTLGLVVAVFGLGRILHHKLLPARTDRRWRALAGRLGRVLRGLVPETGPLSHADLVLAARLMLATLLTLMVFQSVPELDLWVSGLFHWSGEGFALDREPVLQTLRWTYKLTLYASLLAVLVMWVMAARLEEVMKVPARLWGFALAAFVLGPGLVANGILKAYWGRARPADVDAFGGAHPFSPVGLRSDSCVSNCSFVSGEGSGIAMLGIVLIAIFWPRLRSHRGAVWLIGLCVVVGAALRVVKGRHFLSDTIMAVLFMALLALVLFHALRVREARGRVTAANLLHDLQAIGTYARTQGRSDLRLLFDGMVAMLAAVPATVAGLRRPQTGRPAPSLRAALAAGLSGPGR